MNYCMGLTFLKKAEDKRGKIFFYSFDGKQINFIEIKKNFARGGHYHKFGSNHLLLSGKIKYAEKNLDTNLETIKIINAPDIIHTPSKIAHLLIALEDTLFIEVFDDKYEAIIYPPYRQIVQERIC